MIGPIAGNDRIHELDVLRGIALLGVLIGNLAEFFLAPMAATAGRRLMG